VVVASPVGVVSVFEPGIIAVEVASLDTVSSVVRPVVVAVIGSLKRELDEKANSVLSSVVKVAAVDEGCAFEVVATSVPEVDNPVCALIVASGRVLVVEDVVREQPRS
jgi:hypothetical protein